MTPETKARQQIDQKLEQAGWVIQDMKQLNLGAALGVAVREYPTDNCVICQAHPTRPPIKLADASPDISRQLVEGGAKRVFLLILGCQVLWPGL
jgi:hypothetical protein